MTAVDRPLRPAGVIDVRCSAELGSAPRGMEGRCQLFAGHDGPHALMYGRRGARLVRTWRVGDAASVRDSETLQRPWMFGFPVPAWYEVETAAELTR